MRRPTYKKIILDKTQIDQLTSYLGIALDNIADHAKLDAVKVVKEIVTQLATQKHGHRKNL